MPWHTPLSKMASKTSGAAWESPENGGLQKDDGAQSQNRRKITNARPFHR